MPPKKKGGKKKKGDGEGKAKKNEPKELVLIEVDPLLVNGGLGGCHLRECKCNYFVGKVFPT